MEVVGMLSPPYEALGSCIVQKVMRKQRLIPNITRLVDPAQSHGADRVSGGFINMTEYS